MIESTHNNRPLFLLSVTDWLARRDVRELRFTEDERECSIEATADGIERGEVILRLAGAKEGTVRIDELEATITAWLAGSLRTIPAAQARPAQAMPHSDAPAKPPPAPPAQSSFEFHLQ